MTLAGQSLPEGASDGYPLPLTLEEMRASKQEHVAIEYWGLAIPEGVMGSYGDAGMTDPGYGAQPSIAVGNNTYKAVRIIGDDYSLYYAVWCTNETELYDLKVCFLQPLPPCDFRHVVRFGKRVDNGHVLHRPTQESSATSWHPSTTRKTCALPAAR